jgi:hypothetical protein
MKSRKEDIQKIVLGVLMAIGIIYGYFDILLNPLKKVQLNTATSVNGLEPEIRKAHSEVKRAQAMEAEAPKAAALVAQVEAMIPEGAPVAWFPPLLTDFFKKQGVEKMTTRLNGEAAELKLAGYRKLTWGVEMPKAECLAFGTAVAELENSEPLVEISALTIESLRDEPAAQRVLLTLNNLAKE